MSEDTIREQILQGIETALAEMTTANGYNLTISNIYRVRKKVDPSELNAAVIWPMPETSERIYKVYQNTMPIKIEIIGQLSSTNASVVSERLLGDLIYCVMNAVKPEVTAMIQDIEYTGGGTEEYPDADQLYIGVHGNFNIRYETVAGDPYSQPS